MKSCTEAKFPHCVYIKIHILYAVVHAFLPPQTYDSAYGRLIFNSFFFLLFFAHDDYWSGEIISEKAILFIYLFFNLIYYFIARAPQCASNYAVREKNKKQREHE